MDVLSDIMTVLRTGTPFAARFEGAAPWGWEFAERPNGLGVQIMLRGSAVATTPAGGVFELAEGDALIVPRGAAMTVADDVGTPAVPPCDATEDRPGPRGSIARFGSAADADATHATLGLSYEIARGRTHPVVASLPDYVHLPADRAARPELTGAIALLEAELRSERSGAQAIVPALLDAVLMYLLRGVIGHREFACGSGGWGAALADPAIAAALEAIHAEPARQWTVASLGTRAGMSRSAFSRRFTALVGQPPLAYLTFWRLTAAARLLADTDAPLSAVARRVGYSSEFAFAAAFKRSFGLPPGRFRRQVDSCDQSRSSTSAAVAS